MYNGVCYLQWLQKRVLFAMIACACLLYASSVSRVTQSQLPLAQ